MKWNYLIIVVFLFRQDAADIRISSVYDTAYRLNISCDTYYQDVNRFSTWLFCPSASADSSTAIGIDGANDRGSSDSRPSPGPVSKDTLSTVKATDDDLKICYLKCQPNCITDRVCYPMVKDCRQQQVSANHSRITWTLDLKLVASAGNWRCTYRNLKSFPLPLAAYHPVSSSTTTATTSTTSQSSTTASTTLSVASFWRSLSSQNTPMTPSRGAIKSDHDKRREKTENVVIRPHFLLWNYLKHPNAVLILFCCVVFSVLLNILFIIRCFVVRMVINRYRRSAKPSGYCIARCFCINLRQPWGPPSPQSRPFCGPPAPLMNVLLGDQQHQQSSTARDDVYEGGLSTGLSSLHTSEHKSQYELHHKGMHCYHQQQQHHQQQQQQPVGNYVVVMGTVPTSSGGSVSSANNGASQRDKLGDLLDGANTAHFPHHHHHHHHQQQQLAQQQQQQLHNGNGTGGGCCSSDYSSCSLASHRCSVTEPLLCSPPPPRPHSSSHEQPDPEPAIYSVPAKYKLRSARTMYSFSPEVPARLDSVISSSAAAVAAPDRSVKDDSFITIGHN